VEADTAFVEKARVMEPEEVRRAERVLMPGVGNFGCC